jgi:hypothetical protein
MAVLAVRVGHGGAALMVSLNASDYLNALKSTEGG